MNFIRAIRRKIENSRTPVGRAVYWLRTHTVDRYHLIDIRSPSNGEKARAAKRKAIR